MPTIDDKLPYKGIWMRDTLKKIMDYCKKYVKPSQTYYYDPCTGHLKDHKGKVVYEHWKGKMLPYELYKQNRIVTRDGDNNTDISVGREYSSTKDLRYRRD